MPLIGLPSQHRRGTLVAPSKGTLGLVWPGTVATVHDEKQPSQLTLPLNFVGLQKQAACRCMTKSCSQHRTSTTNISTYMHANMHNSLPQMTACAHQGVAANTHCLSHIHQRGSRAKRNFCAATAHAGVFPCMRIEASGRQHVGPSSFFFPSTMGRNDSCAQARSFDTPSGCWSQPG